MFVNKICLKNHKKLNVLLGTFDKTIFDKTILIKQFLAFQLFDFARM